MLVIIMHNNSEYLQLASELAQQCDAKTLTIQKQGLGSALKGLQVGFVLSHGQIMSMYNKALAIFLKDEESVNKLLTIMKINKELQRLSLEDEGFICNMPLECVGQQ